MTATTMQKGLASKATRYILGPSIDASSVNSDTEEFNIQHDQKYTYILLDMQLFRIAWMIKMEDPLRWNHDNTARRNAHFEVIPIWW